MTKIRSIVHKLLFFANNRPYVCFIVFPIGLTVCLYRNPISSCGRCIHIWLVFYRKLLSSGWFLSRCTLRRWLYRCRISLSSTGTMHRSQPLLFRMSCTCFVLPRRCSTLVVSLYTMFSWNLPVPMTASSG